MVRGLVSENYRVGIHSISRREQSMKRKLWVVLLVASIFLGACTTLPGEDVPVENLGENPGEEMVFEEEDLAEDEVEEIVIEEEEVAEEDEIIFEEDEGMRIYLESIPPAGQWNFKHLAGETLCGDEAIIKMAPLPIELAVVDISEDGKTMTLTTGSGSITLTQVEVSTEGDLRSSGYKATINTGSGEVNYDVGYNTFGDGWLRGSIYAVTQECTTSRPFIAEPMSP